MSEIRVKSTGTIKLFESDNTSHVTIASPSSLSANRTITIPDADVTLGAGVTLSGSTNNTVATVTGANALVGEANLTFDGSTLACQGSAIFNESGADVDFRVEGDTDVNMIFGDASSNNVGIGIATPQAKLHIRRAIKWTR